LKPILFPSSMKKTTILIHQHFLDDALKALHEEGIMQISEISREDAEHTFDLQPASIHPETTLCVTYEQRLKDLVRILSSHQQKKTGLKAILNPTLPEVSVVEDISTGELYSDIESILTELEKPILKQHHRLGYIKERLILLTDHITMIDNFSSFRMSLHDVGVSSSLIIKTGITDELEEVQTSVSRLDLATLSSHQIKKGKKPVWSVILIGHISIKKDIDRICSQYITEVDLPKVNETPKQATSTFKREMKQLKKEQKEIISDLRDNGNQHLHQLRVLHEQSKIERIRKEINQSFARTQSTILIQGWVKSEDTTALKHLIDQHTDQHAIISFHTPSPNPDHPPTHIKTPSWAKGFKTLVELFAIPRYNEVNPTIIMGIFFVIFFGVMLGDAGYGLVIFILSLVGYLKFGKYSPMIKSWSIMGVMLGSVTILVGLLTYGIFGNLLHMVILGDSSTQLLYQFTIAGIQFPIESIKDPVAILTVALILGLIHLNIGIILGLYQAFKHKKYKELLTEKFCWIPLQIGGGLLIGHFILDWVIPGPIFTIAGILVIIGLIQLLYASGPVGFFDITGYVGDWLSYARLLALGLATAGMALAFNVVSSLLGEMIPYIGIVITIFLLIILHMVNLAIQALGAGVHSLRLQYVEFFNRFYEGGGTVFSPFHEKRIYTQLKKDKNPQITMEEKQI
jgi:V/A-type H+/Na+-transporting ATPase subunit I